VEGLPHFDPRSSKPISARAVAWLERYLKEVRPRLCLDTHTPALFLTAYGDAFNPDVVSRMTADWMKAAGLKGSCHLLRHTCATHMLEGGGGHPLHPAVARTREAGDDRHLHRSHHPPVAGSPRPLSSGSQAGRSIKTAGGRH